MTKRNWPIIQNATCDNLFKPDTKTLTKRIWTCEMQPSSGLLGLDQVPSNVYSAGVAILVLHVALGAFIYRAYFDDQSKTQTKRD
ncbi:vacuolar ATPase assembly integral membrane protein VMA21 homolog isoform X2 [Bombus pyrosoma]|uniref:vacuolar ATPase assembly integral membrane protein VMA21 homolog isoform X2 n=1 Tax=Bombus pyrosoma TaxID=396416 RepID=UPI001CB8FC43|nr:vacuolar ATPase assembly integral membrane protein VMA21 homolog isoform X2 [Bombus pyrosoma]